MMRASFFTWTSTLICCAAGLAVPACVIDNKLGETAEDSGSDEAGSTAGSADTTDDPDPSATSGQLPTATSGDGSTTSPGDPTATGGGTDGPPPETCLPGENWVAWNNDFLEPMPGIDVTGAAVLRGPCTLAGTSSTTPDGLPPYDWQIELDCTMSGRFDGDAGVVDMVLNPTIVGSSFLPLEQWAPVLEGPLELRVVLEWWGMGWSRYLVLHRGDDVVLDLVDGEQVDPLDGVFFLDEIEALLGGEAWHDTLSLQIQDSICGESDGECGGVARSVAVGWAEIGEPVVLHEDQDGMFGTTVRELSYHAWTSSARDLSMPMCTDTPLGDYRVAVWAVEP